MSSLDIQKLKSVYSLDKKHLASLITSLLLLENGEKLKSNLGTIERLEGDTFRISVTDSNLNNLVDELVHTDNTLVSSMIYGGAKR